MNLDLNVQKTPQQSTIDQISQAISSQAQQMLMTYRRLRQLTGYTTSGKNSFGLATADIWALIDAQKPEGIDAAEYAKMAQATKAFLNLFITPAPITDDVPVATLTFPG